MNPMLYQTMAATPPQQWNPFFPPNPCPSSNFWNPFNVQERLKELHETLLLANAMQKELQMLAKAKEAKESESDGADADGLCKFSQFLEDNRIDLGSQELISVESANGLMAKLRSLLEPFRVVTDESTPWEEKSAVFRLNDKINKSKRNKRWRKKKRKRIAEAQAKECEQFDKLDKEADEWRAREIAKDIAQRKVEKMKEIAKQKAKEEKERLEAELELALMVEKLQELRSIRIQKLKKQDSDDTQLGSNGNNLSVTHRGHFLPEEDDKFLEKVRAAVEEEERQAEAAADTDAAKDAIAAAEESRKATFAVKLDKKDESNKDDDGRESQEQKTESGSVVSEVPIHKELEKPVPEGQGYRAYDYVASLPPEFYHYYHGSNTDMGTLIEVRRMWDAYIRPGGSRIPGHWVQAPPPSDEIWASYLAPPK